MAQSYNLLTINNKQEDGGTSSRGRLTAQEFNAVVDAINNNSNDVLDLKTLKYAYGISYNKNVSDPTCTRIGNLALHRTLPVQSAMRGCLLADDGTVNKYLDASDWTSETRDGSAGQVMVEIPEHYERFVTDGDIREVWLSMEDLPGFFKVSKMYVSAYQASLSGTKFCSVSNVAPTMSVSRTQCRTYARNRGVYGLNGCGWNQMLYQAQRTLFWFFVVEYATRNSQLDFNAALTTEGYHQGGLGMGYTYSMGANNGFTDSLGNGTGEVEVDTDGNVMCRYRGVENPFGNLYEWCDGINILVGDTVANGGDGKTKFYVCDDPSKFSDTSCDDYTLVGSVSEMVSGSIKEVLFGDNGDIIPISAASSYEQYFCDDGYIWEPGEVGLYGVQLGGAIDSACCGLACFIGTCVPSAAYSNSGSRLCFLPA